METLEVKLLSNQVNSPVIQLPYRNYPGVLIQGDSLFILYSRAESLRDMLKQNQPEQLSDEELLTAEDTPLDLANELVDLLAGYVVNYRSACKEHGIG
jgi:hypothetical protein